MGVAIDAGSFGGWGVAAEKVGEAAKVGTRVNPIGVLLTGLFTPSELGDGTITGMLNRQIDMATTDIEDSRSTITQAEKIRLYKLVRLNRKSLKGHAIALIKNVIKGNIMEEFKPKMERE